MIKFSWWGRPRTPPDPQLIILLTLERLMADTSALTAAAASLKAAVGVHSAAVEDIRVLVSSGSDNDKAAVDGATEVVSSATAQLEAGTAVLQSLKPTPVAAPVVNGDSVNGTSNGNGTTN